MGGMKKFAEKYRYSMILLRELVKTEFKLKYQNSVLGYLWSILKPLCVFAVMYVVFAHIFDIGRDVEHFPVFLLMGIMLWNFFTETVSNGLMSVVSRADLMRKISFPRYVIILASGFQASITMLFSLVILIILAIVTGVEWSWTALLLPVFILKLFVLANACSFIFAVLYVKTRDMKYVWEVIQQVMFYATPIVYPIGMVAAQWPNVARLLMLNPAAEAIQGARWAVVTREAQMMTHLTDRWWLVVLPWVIVMVAVWVAYKLYKRYAPEFAEKA